MLLMGRLRSRFIRQRDNEQKFIRCPAIPGESREVGALSAETPVDLFPVPHLDHKDEEDLILNLVDDAVVLSRPDVDAVELLLRCEPFHPVRAGILLQPEEVRANNLTDMRVQLPNVPLGGWGQFDSTGQASVSQLANEVPEGGSPLLLRFLQSSPGVFEVLTVHLRLRQALQKAEVFYGNDGGQVLSPAGHDRPLLAVGGAVHDIRKLLPSLRNIQSGHETPQDRTNRTSLTQYKTPE